MEGGREGVREAVRIRLLCSSRPTFDLFKYSLYVGGYLVVGVAIPFSSHTTSALFFIASDHSSTAVCIRSLC